MKPFWTVPLLLAALFATSCHQEAHGHEGPDKLLVTSPLRRDVEVPKEYVAQIRAHQHIEVRAFEHGYLQDLFFDEGQEVAAGKRMFQIVPVIQQAEVAEAQAEADRAAIERTNSQKLAEKNVVSAQEVALANAAVAKAEARLSLAKTHRGLTEMRAPFSGRMGRFYARRGSLIAEGDLLTTLSDSSKVWAYFNVSEAEYLTLKAATPEPTALPVQLRMANGALFSNAGAIETIEAEFDSETGTIAFRAGFQNPEGLLRHGETGKVLLTRPLKDALLIPQKATFEVLDKKFVFVVDNDSTVHSRPITVSAEFPQLFAVSEGLVEGDRILVEGLRKVREGDVISPTFQAPAELFAHLETAAE